MVPVSLLRHAEFALSNKFDDASDVGRVVGFAGRCAAEHILFEAGRIVVEILPRQIRANRFLCPVPDPSPEVALPWLLAQCKPGLACLENALVLIGECFVRVPLQLSSVDESLLGVVSAEVRGRLLRRSDACSERATLFWFSVFRCSFHIEQTLD